MAGIVQETTTEESEGIIGAETLTKDGDCDSRVAGSKFIRLSIEELRIGDTHIRFREYINPDSDMGQNEKVIYEMMVMYIAISKRLPNYTEIPIVLEVGSSMYLANDNDSFMNTSNNKPLTTIWWLRPGFEINSYQIYSHSRNYLWVFNPHPDKGKDGEVLLQKEFPGSQKDKLDLFLINSEGSNSIAPYFNKDLRIQHDTTTKIKKDKFNALSATSLFTAEGVIRPVTMPN